MQFNYIMPIILYRGAGSLNRFRQLLSMLTQLLMDYSKRHVQIVALHPPPPHKNVLYLNPA